MFKKYSIRCPYCGATHKTWEWWIKFKLVFTDKIYYICSVCHHTSCWRHLFRLVHDSVDSLEKDRNREKLFDNRMW